jgi:integrase
MASFENAATLPAVAPAIIPRSPARSTRDEQEAANLYALSELVAARAARPSTRRMYRTIYWCFCAFLRDELDRPPTLADLSADAIAAYHRHLEQSGGRAGAPASLATRRVHMTMLRALARELGRPAVADGVRVPSHRVGPPETLAAQEYANLLRVPDRRSAIGRRDHAILRLLGDCGLRNAELRGLEGRAVRRPRANARHHALYVHGKGGVEREVPIPTETKAALDAWLSVHPLARAGGLADEQPLFVGLGRYGDARPLPLSNQGLNHLVRRAARGAGIPERLAHPHVLRAYYATTLAAEGVAVHLIARRLGHASIQTTSRYLAEVADEPAGVADVLDRRHQRLRRERRQA